MPSTAVRSERDVLSQLPLFLPGEEEFGEPDADSDEPSVRRRPRTYDHAILRYVGYYRLVTTQQVIYRFFLYAGRGPEYGYRVVRQLVRRGLLDESPLDPERGNVSQNVLSVTREGWRFLGRSMPSRGRRSSSSPVRQYRIQFADVMLDREVEGWNLVNSTAAFPVLKEWARQRYRGRMLNSSEAQIRDRLERLHPFDFPLHLLVRPSRGEIRLILPVRTTLSYRSTIDKLPGNMGLFPKLHFELVTAELDLGDAAASYLERWGKKHPAGIEIHRSEHFRSRPHPRSFEGERINRYKKNGVPDPRALLL